MPITLPPPPPPYVAPDLRPLVASDSARLTFVRDPRTGAVRMRVLEHGVWMAAEGAPLEVRTHKGEDGKLTAEQAFYVRGERGTGAPSNAATAQLAPVDASAVRSLGELRRFVRFTVRSTSGTQLRTWDAAQCAEDRARLDRADSPVDPTFAAGYDDCDPEGSYVLGRTFGLDRGWALALPQTAARMKPLPAGRYLLDITVNPTGVLADADRSNDTATVPLTVRVTSRIVQVEPGAGDMPAPRGAVRARAADAKLAGASVHPHADGSSHVHRAVGRSDGREAGWVAASLLVVEQRLAASMAKRVAGTTGRASRAAGEATAAPAGVDLPNLRSAPSYGIATRRATTGRGRRDLLEFGALTWNTGPGRLEVEAFRERGTTLSAYQVFFRDDERAARQPRGTLVWHAAPGHDHFHFGAFARYRLTTLTGATVRDSGKRSWCVIDTDTVDTTVVGAPSPAFNPDPADSGGCGTSPGSLWARLGLSVGAGDYYSQSIAGQAFDITGVRNGAYQVRIEANPERLIAEGDYTDNDSLRVVVLGGRPGARTVRVRAVPTVVDPGPGEELDF